MSSKCDVISLLLGKKVDYPLEQELYETILKEIYKYEGRVSTVSVVGILHVLENQMLESYQGD